MGPVRWFGLRCDYHINVLIQRDQEPQQTLDGKPTDVAAHKLGDVGLSDVEQRRGLLLRQAAFATEMGTNWRTALSLAFRSRVIYP